MKLRMAVLLMILLMLVLYFQVSTQKKISSKQFAAVKTFRISSAPQKNLSSAKSVSQQKLIPPAPHKSQVAVTKAEIPLSAETNTNAKNEASQVDDIIIEFEQVNELWFKVRDQAYLNLGITDSESKSLENLRLFYQNEFDELLLSFKKTSNLDSQTKIVDQIQTQIVIFNSNVLTLLGDDRFQYLLAVCSQFNSDLDNTQLRPRVANNW